MAQLPPSFHWLFVGDNTTPIAEGMAQGLGLSLDEMRAHPHALFGSVDEICEELERRRERFGISYITVGAEALAAFAPEIEPWGQIGSFFGPLDLFKGQKQGFLPQNPRF